MVQLYAVPQSGTYFALWGNAGSGSSNPLNFVLTNANPTVSSLFASLGAGEFALTVIPNGFGQIILRLTLTGEFGGRYRIDSSTNLLDWTQLVTLTNTFGTTQFTDGLATNMPLRFYKAVAVP